MKLTEMPVVSDDVPVNSFVIDTVTARRFERVKEMVRKLGFNNITEPEIIDAILSEITTADAAGIFIEYKLKIQNLCFRQIRALQSRFYVFIFINEKKRTDKLNMILKEEIVLGIYSWLHMTPISMLVRNITSDEGGPRDRSFYGRQPGCPDGA